jgi:amphiphysin
MLVPNLLILKLFFFKKAMTTAQVRIAQTMEGFYDESAPMGPAGMEYKRVIEKLDEEARSNLVKLIKKTTMGIL